MLKTRYQCVLLLAPNLTIRSIQMLCKTCMHLSAYTQVLYIYIPPIYLSIEPPVFPRFSRLRFNSQFSPPMQAIRYYNNNQ